MIKHLSTGFDQITKIVTAKAMGLCIFDGLQQYMTRCKPLIMEDPETLLVQYCVQHHVQLTALFVFDMVHFFVSTYPDTSKERAMVNWDRDEDHRPIVWTQV